MRIVNYHPRARVGDGGITNSVRRLAEAWARQGAVPVIAFDGRGRPFDEDGVRWWPIRHVGRGALRVPVDGLGPLGGADWLVLNSAWTAANLRLGAAARRQRVPYVLAPRGAYDPLILQRRARAKRVWWQLGERRLVADAAAVHVFFPEQGRHLDELEVPVRLLVAPNGVVPPGHTSWDGGSGGYVLYLGRYDPEHKGIDLLLRACAALPAGRRPQLRLHGSDWRGGRVRVEGLVADLGLADVVTVGPPVHGEHKWRVVARARGLVYPSRWEGFGNSLAEAAALGVPCLATPYPLARELGAAGACLVVPPTVEDLADGLRRLIAPQAAAVGQRARRHVAEHLGWDQVAASWLRQLAALGSAPRGVG
ncbi:glycosyltransferase [Egicoccus halophilus]|uniref:Uncharacterized protein n=1 Tax=Egicoccus halophilus TaxID=1670830 RepID=A0A8J3ADN5_9ACTN|nr:glycosyltransferase [Egicoccus halophilus]GGI05452.1 hypothetical protein GCM10011354_14170 [Egicoccus halophilus]